MNVLWQRPINAGLNTAHKRYMEAASTHVQRGLQAMKRRDHEKAVLEFKYAVMAANEGAQRNETALSHLRGDALGSLNLKRTTRAQQQLKRGAESLDRKQYRRAIQLLSEAINLCPVSAVPSFAMRGKAQLGLKKWRAAVADLSIALAYSPRMVDALEARATAFEALGDESAAQQDLDHARRTQLHATNPPDPKAEAPVASHAKSVEASTGSNRVTTVKRLVVFLANHRPNDEPWYIRQLLPAIGLSLSDLEGTQIDFRYTSSDNLNAAYISGFATAEGHLLDNCIMIPFNDADGGRGQVLKVLG